MKRNVLKAIPYGFIKGIVITVLLELYLSSFARNIAAITILIILLPHSLIEFREINNADGLMLILDLSCFIGISFVLECGISAVIFLKNKGKPQ